jgi:hypothetical protein
MFLNRIGVSRMKRGFRWRKGKNQPSPARVHRTKSKNILKETAVCVSVLAEENNVRASDHGFSQPGLCQLRTSNNSVANITDP